MGIRRRSSVDKTSWRRSLGLRASNNGEGRLVSACSSNAVHRWTPGHDDSIHIQILKRLVSYLISRISLSDVMIQLKSSIELHIHAYLRFLHRYLFAQFLSVLRSKVCSVEGKLLPNWWRMTKSIVVSDDVSSTGFRK